MKIVLAVAFGGAIGAVFSRRRFARRLVIRISRLVVGIIGARVVVDRLRRCISVIGFGDYFFDRRVVVIGGHGLVGRR